jgi:hypothetical protein
MKEDDMLEPALPGYLNTPYDAKPLQRGGTLIAEDVWTIEEHRERVLEPDGYRPEECPGCGRGVHGHGCRCRRLRDQPDSAWEEIRRYMCPGCKAVWQVLPAFLARHLQRAWGAIQSRLVAGGVLERTGAEWRVRSIPTTLRRWSLRLAAAAIVLTQALMESGDAEVSSAFTGFGGWCSRAELVEGLAEQGLVAKAHKVGELAAWVHRVTPGVRVM